MDELVVLGTVLTVDADRRTHARGAVYIHDGVIERVADARRRRPPATRRRRGARRRCRRTGPHRPAQPPRVQHPAAVGRPDEAYGTRYQWPGAATYGPDVSNPAQALGIAAPAAALRFAEVKAAVGGVTVDPRLTAAHANVPGLDGAQRREREARHRAARSSSRCCPRPQATRPDRNPSRRRAARSSTTSPKASTRRCAKSSRSSTTTTASSDGLVGIHSTALTDADFRHWSSGRRLGRLVAVLEPLAVRRHHRRAERRRHGLRVCLGSDWTPSGTRNVLGELKVAARWNRVALGGALDPADLVELVTANPGDTLAGPWGVPVGRLVDGALADLACFTDCATTLGAACSRRPSVTCNSSSSADVRSTATGRCSTPPASGSRADHRRRHPARRRDGPADALLPTEPDLRAEATKSWRSGQQELDAVWKDPGRAVRARGGSRAFGVEPFSSFPTCPDRTAAKHARAHRRRARPAGDADVRRHRSHRRLVRAAAAVVSRPRRDPVRPRRRVLTDVRRRARPRAIIRSVSASRRARARNMLIAI